jgi:hypothetical protein
MNVRMGSIVIVLLLSCAIIGGCPAPIDDTDGVTNSDNNGPADSGGDTTPSGGPSSDGGTSDGSSSPAGDGSGTDGGLTPGDGGSGSDDGGGTPDSGNGDTSGGDDASPVFQGTYSGEMTHVKHEAVVEGNWKLEQQWTTSFSVTFDESGMPTAFVVPAYNETEGGIEFVVEINEVGETVTLNESSGGHDITLTATVVLANYGETSGRVVLNLEHSGQEIVEEEGTGVHVVQYELDGDNLLYSAETNYEVQLAGMVWSYWWVQSEGTLSPE